MNEILGKRVLAPNVTEYTIAAGQIAQKALPGQFVMLRVDEDGERIPLTICDCDPAKGTVTLLVQEAGYSTRKLSFLKAGEYVRDFVGPLGNPTDLSAYKNIVLVGGGIGAAVIYPQAKLLKSQNRPADVILGARSRELLMYESEFLSSARNLYRITDDGSSGKKGFVTDVLKELIPQNHYDCVFAVGPMPMMRAVCNVTEEYGIRTVVSMNAVMVDGTGMCGGCRLTVGGETKYACVHGPEFDGHLIDWIEAINRSRAYLEEEKAHLCRLK